MVLARMPYGARLKVGGPYLDRAPGVVERGQIIGFNERYRLLWWSEQSRKEVGCFHRRCASAVIMYRCL